MLEIYMAEFRASALAERGAVHAVIIDQTQFPGWRYHDIAMLKIAVRKFVRAQIANQYPKLIGE